MERIPKPTTTMVLEHPSLNESKRSRLGTLPLPPLYMNEAPTSRQSIMIEIMLSIFFFWPLCIMTKSSRRLSHCSLTKPHPSSIRRTSKDGNHSIALSEEGELGLVTDSSRPVQILWIKTPMGIHLFTISWDPKSQDPNGVKIVENISTWESQSTRKTTWVRLQLSNISESQVAGGRMTFPIRITSLNCSMLEQISLLEIEGQTVLHIVADGQTQTNPDDFAPKQVGCCRNIQVFDGPRLGSPG